MCSLFNLSCLRLLPIQSCVTDCSYIIQPLLGLTDHRNYFIDSFVSTKTPGRPSGYLILQAQRSQINAGRSSISEIQIGREMEGWKVVGQIPVFLYSLVCSSFISFLLGQNGSLVWSFIDVLHTTATQSRTLHFIANFLFRYRDDICILAIILSSPAAVSIISMIKQKLIYNLNKSSQCG